MKIFELAKELDVKPLELVEDLKSKGFNVRNHMASLTDDEIEKYKDMLANAEGGEDSADSKKTKKKKTTKKKKATKKKAAKKTVVRKKTVIRKKNDEGAVDESLEVKEPEVETPETIAASEATTEGIAESKEAKPAVESEDEGSTGLRVVSKPENSEEAPAVEAQEEAPSKEIYKEKVHTFTPVYIPPKEEKKESSDSKEGGDDSADGKKDDSRKRMGGLASMISGKSKVGVINRSRELTTARSEEELKAYSTLSSYGRPIYSQIGRKKIFTGSTSQTEITEVKESKRIVYIHGACTAGELAQKLSVKFKELADQVLDMNLLLKEDDYIGVILANEIASMYNYRAENKAFDEDKYLGKEELTDEQISKFPLRNPIITIMGHVDHGKTTLLDHIRKSKVVSGEAGGITQHIGAYSVKVNDKTITFLDTPGHAAFGAMRQRGANVTDLVVLVVAADDGVMPQTKESIRFCEQAEVPVIVAINKMDKEGVNPDRVKQELTEFNITPEEWGGDTQFVPISALKGQGVDDLLESIALQTEMMELRADPKGKGEGVVIESKIEQGRGPVATILIQSGTLKKGDSIVVGESFGRARSLMDDTGANVAKAGPSVPVQILGLDNPPSPGDLLNVVKNEREAKKVVQNRIAERKEIEAAPSKPKMSLEDFFAASAETTEQKTLNLIIRADVQGSYEAIVQSLESLTTAEVEVKVIAGGVGPINDNDVNLASSSAGYIIGFNMRPVTSARRLAEQHGIDIKTYSIIYELINDIKLAIEGLLDPEFVETFIGRAEVRETFSIPKIGLIAGSLVVDGSIKAGCNIRLLRNGKIIFDGKMSSLKRFKDDVKEVKNGFECGIGLEDFNDVKKDDLFEAYLLEEKKRTYDDVAESGQEN